MTLTKEVYDERRAQLVEHTRLAREDHDRACYKRETGTASDADVDAAAAAIKALEERVEALDAAWRVQCADARKAEAERREERRIAVAGEYVALLNRRTQAARVLFEAAAEVVARYREAVDLGREISSLGREFLNDQSRAAVLDRLNLDAPLRLLSGYFVLSGLRELGDEGKASSARENHFLHEIDALHRHLYQYALQGGLPGVEQHDIETAAPEPRKIDRSHILDPVTPGAVLGGFRLDLPRGNGGGVLGGATRLENL